MSNQKTSQLRRLQSIGVASGDLLPIVDVSEVTSPTGETKYITAADFATYVVSGGFIDLSTPYQGLQYSNGLVFDESVTPSVGGERCFGDMSALGTQFSLMVKGYVASDRVAAITAHRVLFGVGANTTPSEGGAYSNNSAYIAISDNDLIAYVQDGSANYSMVTATNFFTTYSERAFVAGLVKTSGGTLTLYINGVAYASASAVSVGTISNTKAVMGNGRLSEKNVKCTIYEAHVFNASLSPGVMSNTFYRGIDTAQSSLIASYNPANLNPTPSQWLDSVNMYHILTPTIGASAASPSKRFTLSFTSTATGYLGDASERVVLPENYVLTSCMVESTGKPLLSVGSFAAVAPVSASGTGSWRDNRVAFVRASYGKNPLNLLTLGVAHDDRTLYAAFSGSASPCTFSFDGYVRA